MSTGYRLKGHESFVLREGWLTKGIVSVKKNRKVFQENCGADILGVGTNMAKSIRYWLKASGLIAESLKGAVLSELGEIIHDNDLFLEDIFSLWIIHINIARNYELATSWNVFFNKYNIKLFNRDELFQSMEALLKQVTGEAVLPERSIKDDCLAILSMYANNEGDECDPEEKRYCPFNELHLVDYDKKHYIKQQPSRDLIDPLIVLYMINDTLQREGSIPIDDIAYADNMPGKILNMNRITINDYLDGLQEKNLITINRTAGLDMVYPNEKLADNNILLSHYKG